MARKEIRPEDVTVIVDTREQLPYEFPMMRSVKGTLQTGDYSVLGLENYVVFERKSTSDLLGCIGRDRDRFEDELQRLMGFHTRAVVVEASWADLCSGYDCGIGEPWRSRLTPEQVTNAIEAWHDTFGVDFIMAGGRGAAQKTVARRLFHAARHQWERCLSFLPTLRIA